MKLAQALLLRKQLERKVAQLEPLRLADPKMFEVQTKRMNVTDQTDEISFHVPKLQLSDVTAEYDKYATALRKLDAAIQHANWNYDLTEFTDSQNPFENTTTTEGAGE